MDEKRVVIFPSIIKTHLSFFGVFMVLNFLNEKKGDPKQTLFVRKHLLLHVIPKKLYI